MRLYRSVSPVLLLLLVLGLALNTDGISASAFKGNIDYKKLEQYDTLKNDLDERIYQELGPLQDMNDMEGLNIVAAAKEEVGNVGGEPYWRWYGYNSRVAWCAVFVSYCAEKCGYIEAGIIPKFASVPTGVNWFKSRNLWLKKGSTPTPGMIIFFDFENYTAGIYWTNDGSGDHVGIVEKVKDNVVYCIEGNNKDACRETSYPIDSRWILGYGTPDYSKIH